MRSRFGGLLAAMAILAGACGGAGSPTTSPMPTTAPSVVPPISTPSPTPTPTPTLQPAAATTRPTTSPAAVGAASLPVRANAASISVRLAPAGGGRLFMAVPAEMGTVLALLDAKGKVRSGWPALLKGASDCEIDADPADGSVRAVCAVGKSVRAYALGVGGRLMSGWPVELRGGSLQTYRSDGTRIVDGDLYVLLQRWGENGFSATVARVSVDGLLRMGVTVPSVGHSGCCSAIGPDGSAYLLGDEGIWGLNLDGVRPGFPVRIEGWASSPSFGPGGRLYVAADDPDASDGPPSSEVVAITQDGGIAPDWPVEIPIDTWTALGDPTGPPYAPVALSDGSAYVRGWVADLGGVAAYALGPSGARRPGWPFRSDETIKFGRPSAFVCPCEPCVVPDYSIDTPPLAGPGDSLLLVQIGDESVSGGNRVVAIRPDGKVKAGWPVTLTEPGSWFAGIATDGDDLVFGYAVEPAGTRRNDCGEKDSVYSGTIVALDGHGDSIYTTAIIAP